VVQATQHDQDEEPRWWRWILLADDDDGWLEFDDEPSMNLDGTPMAGGGSQ
jgi:hypothetical protein